MEDGEKRSQTSRDWPRPTLTLTPKPEPEKETQPHFSFQKRLKHNSFVSLK
jgi:hypothetical protein